MKLSVKLDYACRALACLAKRYESGDVSRIDELAEVEEIPANYLVQILSDLRNGGVVESRRGKQGGYLLARKPMDISLHEIISLVQGDIFNPGLKTAGASGQEVAAVWAKLQSNFEEAARSITLQDVIAGGSQVMYYI